MFELENKKYRVWWKYSTGIEKVETVVLKKHGRKHTLIKRLSKRTTTCTIQCLDHPEKVWSGVSECSPDDMDYRPRGRGISLNRAVEAMLSDGNRTTFSITYSLSEVVKIRRKILAQICSVVNIVLE